MSLLTICQRVADESGVYSPTRIVGGADITAKRLLAAAKSAGRDLSEGKIRNASGVLVGAHNWQALRKEVVFNTAAGDSDYKLDATGIIADGDYRRMVEDTLWDRTNDQPISYVTVKDWQDYVSGVITLGIEKISTIRGGQLLIYTTPESVDQYSFEYISNSWCQSAAGAAQNTWLADTDEGILDEELLFLGTKWRFKEMSGLPYGEDKLDYLESVHMAMSSDTPSGTIQAHGDLWEQEKADRQLPDTGYG